ncbi:MAG: alpha-ketoacid dehydrogenase subunit beta [Candidatus Scalindua sp.]|jgi:acetoin:2,6-dichlorophenolindophenol oxidoreductase subunit beta|nr:alpha-ketoacid dehydrogenase subunit beta [Candidatus Scalindua sp.]
MKYSEAIRDALSQSLKRDERVFLMGLGVTDAKGVFGSTTGLQEEFGSQRVFDIPVCENTIVGIMNGASMQGMRPIMVNQRIDFILYAMDQIINHSAKWKWMFGGAQKLPIVIRAIVGRGWGQGPQHSQSMHALFAHIPGLKVVAPVTPYDAKGLLIASLEDDDPVIFIEHRRLYDIEGDVPDGLYSVPIGKAAILREGSDITLVASSQMVLVAQRAGVELAKVNISAEIIDLRTLRPLDEDTVLQSVQKTGHLIVIDSDWKACGIAGEILAIVAEHCPFALKSPAIRLTWPDIPTPTSIALEDLFYTKATDIYKNVFISLGHPLKEDNLQIEKIDQPFEGPF